jgi:hypothetical protein
MRNNNTTKLLREEKGKRGCTLFLRFGRLQAATGTKQSRIKHKQINQSEFFPLSKKNQKIILLFCASPGNFSTIGCKKRERTNWPKQARAIVHSVNCCRGIVRSRASRAQRRGGATLVLQVSKERSPNPRSQ